MKYKSVVLTKRGGPEVLQVFERELRVPKSKEVQIKILACGVGRTDIAMRYGFYPFAPKIPFVPGYEIVGSIAAVGENVKNFKKGDVVAALTGHGGYSEYIYIEEEHLVKVPEGVKPEEAVSLILNYVTAYQMLRRVANVKKRDKILVTGGSGGVGNALLDLSKLFELTAYALSSKSKHHIIKELGGVPVDYKNENWMDEIKNLELHGFDYVFDGIGSTYISIGFGLLKKEGKLVAFGYPSFLGMVTGALKIKVLNVFSKGKRGESYGISALYKKDKSTILSDLELLMGLLKEKKISPKITLRMPILKASEANAILENGEISGKIVLLSNELL